MRKVPWSERRIYAKQGKLLCCQQMEAFHDARNRKQCEIEMVVHIKEMRTRIREIGLKEEEKFQQCEKAIKKLENELKFW
jgi:hypothetical protein